MKKLIIYTSVALAVLFTGVSCTKDLTDLNNDKKKPAGVSQGALFASAQKELVDAVTSTNVNLNIFRLIVQHWQETTYLDESRYDLNTRSIPDNFWDAIYTDVVKDLEESRGVVNADATISDGVKKNQIAQIEIMSVYAFSVGVNTFGDIPYKKAMDIENIFPSYDGAQAIYDDMIVRLNAAIGALDAGSGSFDNSDLIYRGDIVKWKKFANSLKMRLGMILADVSPAVAKKIVEEASPGAFGANDDNATFPYSTVPPNTNPLWEDLVQSQRQDFVGANTLIDFMNARNDPRRAIFFTQRGGTYIGGNPGSSSPFSNFSGPGTLLTKKDLVGLLIDYAEVEFMRAEALERQFAVGGTPKEHYDNAIRASFQYWGLTTADADTYLARPDVAYATATGTYKQKIGEQKWVALYNRGYDAWVEWRRLDFPKLKVPNRAQSVTPLRFTYSIDEQNLNRTNYDAAAAAIGGDVVATKLFWDKF
ncbi:SusD/RagB family nutrient-binding outer membrane lipoprotein [Chitinophaga defluvii]|uniref:SusD/RagB family nutrient-binding outer membrane lipoprotein n=1 Tax=Chitinophaga defluvii TaxID=3163343 RepID=A0ABV2TE46_9BACT